MSNKRGDFGGRLAGGVAALLAAFCARKLLTFAWTRVTGKQPPEHPEDPQVRLAEALGWSIVTGVGGATARLLASRAAAKRLHGGHAHPAE